MGLTKTLLILFGIFFGFFISAIVMGDIANSMSASLYNDSGLLHYTIWFVAAVFAAIAYYAFAIDKINKSKALADKKWLLLVVPLIIIIPGLVFLHKYFWINDNGADINFIPFNIFMTYTYIVTFILIVISQVWFEISSKKTDKVRRKQ